MSGRRRVIYAAWDSCRQIIVLLSHCVGAECGNSVPILQRHCNNQFLCKLLNKNWLRKFPEYQTKISIIQRVALICAGRPRALPRLDPVPLSIDGVKHFCSAYRSIGHRPNGSGSSLKMANRRIVSYRGLAGTVSFLA